MKTNKGTLFTDIIAALFILLFLYTAITKVAEQEQFANVMRQSPLIGNYSYALSWIIPILEIITALILFLPFQGIRQWGFTIAFMLMSGFTLYILYMLLFAPDLPCSCGGVISGMTWVQHFIFNIFFTILAAFGVWYSIRNKLFIAINRNSRNPV